MWLGFVGLIVLFSGDMGWGRKIKIFCIIVWLCLFLVVVKFVVVECNLLVFLIVVVDELYYRYYLYFLWFYWCEGLYGYESFNIKKCVVIESREVIFLVYDIINRLLI